MRHAMSQLGKGLKKFMNDKIDVCREFLSSAQNRLISGLIILGIGVGLGIALIVSAYLKVS